MKVFWSYERSVLITDSTVGKSLEVLSDTLYECRDPHLRGPSRGPVVARPVRTYMCQGSARSIYTKLNH